MLSLAMSCVQLKHLSSAIRSISNHRPVSKTPINLSVLETLSHQCRNFKEFKQILSQMVFTGLIKDTFAAKRLLQFSTRDLPFIHVDYFYQIFNFIEIPDATFYNIMMMAYVQRQYTHNIMMIAYVQRQYAHRVVPFYKLMLYRNVGPNVYTYPFLVEACAARGSQFEGKQMHNHVLKLGFDSDVDVRSTFVDMYADCFNYDDARKVFDEGPMMDSFVWYSILNVCMTDRAPEVAEDIYSLIPERDTIASTYMIVNSWLWGNYEKCEQLINEIPENDTVSWSELTNYCETWYNEMYEEALNIFIRMHHNGVMIDELVLEAVVRCCKKLSRLHRDVNMMGKLIHSLGVKIGVECEVELQNSMICMYSEFGETLSAQNLFNAACWLDQRSWYCMLYGYMKCGLDEDVKALFESMPEKNRFYCGLLMIDYYGDHSCFSEGLALFHMMVGSGTTLDEEDLGDIILNLPACFAAVDLGKCLHGYVIKNGYCLMGSLIKKLGFTNRDSVSAALWSMYEWCRYEHNNYNDERGFY